MKPKYMKLSYKLLSLLILLNFVYGISIGQNALKNQPTAVPFLLITPDAKSAGMANVNLGISASTNDLFQNAAKLALMNEKSGFTLNYTPWLKDIGLENVYILTSGYYKKINNSSAYHVSLKYFTLGTIDLTDEKGMINQPSQRTGEYNINAGYSLRISNKLSLGATIKYIHSKLIQGYYNGSEYKAGNAIAGDISLYYQQNENAEGLHGGLLLSNLGSKMSYSSQNNKYFLPANLGLGIGYMKNLDENNGLEFGIDINRKLVPALASDASQEDIQTFYNQSVLNSWTNSFSGKFGVDLGSAYVLSGGIEYNYDKLFFLRAGYHYEQNLNSGNSNYFTVGSTIKYNNMNLHLSYIPPTSAGISRNPLSNTVSFGTSISFK